MKKYSVAILNLIAGGLFLTVGYSSYAQNLVEELTTKMKNPELSIGFGYIFLIFGIIHFLINYFKRTN
ncbi:MULTISPECIES: hypothetical protein [unclassified Sutcliffiella]|uniref:hypothetical protein n=1 Tax=unclassified Sutcliffiella TaxID=2837532 RepID=UPI0030CB0EDD